MNSTVIQVIDQDGEPEISFEISWSNSDEKYERLLEAKQMFDNSSDDELAEWVEETPYVERFFFCDTWYR